MDRKRRTVNSQSAALYQPDLKVKPLYRRLRVRRETSSPGEALRDVIRPGREIISHARPALIDGTLRRTPAAQTIFSLLAIR